MREVAIIYCMSETVSGATFTARTLFGPLGRRPSVLGRKSAANCTAASAKRLVSGFEWRKLEEMPVKAWAGGGKEPSLHDDL